MELLTVIAVTESIRNSVGIGIGMLIVFCLALVFGYNWGESKALAELKETNDKLEESNATIGQLKVEVNRLSTILSSIKDSVAIDDIPELLKRAKGIE